MTATPPSVDSSTLTTIYIVRHGESEANRQMIFGGNFPLSPKGMTQAQALAQSLGKIKFDAIFSSDLTRAQQTVEQIALEQQIQVVALEALRERFYGEVENQTYEDLTQELRTLIDSYTALTEEQYWRGTEFPGGETNEQAFARFITKLREIAIAYAGQTVLIGSHGNIMRNLLVKLGFANFVELKYGAIANTSWVKLESDGSDFFIRETHDIVPNRAHRNK